MDDNDTGLQAYKNSTMEIYRRILALIPNHPEILEIQNVYDLRDVEGFKSDDLGVSFAQVSGALSAAKEVYRRAHPNG